MTKNTPAEAVKKVGCLSAENSGGIYLTTDDIAHSAGKNNAPYSVLYYQNPPELYDALIIGSIDALVDVDVNVPPDFKIIQIFNPVYYYVAASPSRRFVFNQVNSALSLSLQLNRKEYDSFIDRISPSLRSNWLSFSSEEKEYVNTHNVLKIAVIDDLKPFVYIKDGKCKGMCIDLFSDISQQSGMKIEYVVKKEYAEAWKAVVSGEADVLFAAVNIPPETKEKYVMTNPYMSVSVVSVGPRNKMRADGGKITVVLPEIYAFFRPLIESWQPGSAFIWRDTTSQCLRDVCKNNNYVTYVTDYENLYYGNSYGFSVIQAMPVASEVPVSIVMPREKSYLLLSVLDKSISAIRPNEVQRSFFRYIDDDNSVMITGWMMRHPVFPVVVAAAVVFLISLVAFLIIVNIIKKKKNEEIAKVMDRANRDAMTGVYNRIAFSKYVNGILAHRQHDENGAFVMIDVDNFKLVNDTCGHAAGDKVLVTIASLLLVFFRHGDIVCRMGGDEFAVFMPRVTDRKALVIRMNALMKRMDEEFPQEKFKVRVTFSAGVAFVKSTSTFESLYKAADNALYSVKRQGKNNCIFAD